MEGFGDFWWFGKGWEWTRGKDLQTTFLRVWVEGLSWWDCVLRGLWGEGSFVLYVSNLVILERVGCWWEWSYRKERGWFCGWRTAHWRNGVPERERGNGVPSHSTKRLWYCLNRRELTKHSHSYRQVGDLVAKNWKPCLLASVVPAAWGKAGISVIWGKDSGSSIRRVRAQGLGQSTQLLTSSHPDQCITLCLMFG